jgi:hypothetical protein
VPGIVTDILYLGSHYEVEVALPEAMVIVKIDNIEQSQGDVVYVTFR